VTEIVSSVPVTRTARGGGVSSRRSSIFSTSDEERTSGSPAPAIPPRLTERNARPGARIEERPIGEQRLAIAAHRRRQDGAEEVDRRLAGVHGPGWIGEEGDLRSPESLGGSLRQRRRLDLQHRRALRETRDVEPAYGVEPRGLGALANALTLDDEAGGTERAFLEGAHELHQHVRGNSQTNRAALQCDGVMLHGGPPLRS
jgi:hypothetical protein